MFDFLKDFGGEKDQEVSTADAGGNPPAGMRVENSESAKTLREAKGKGSQKPESGGGTSSAQSGNDLALAQQIKALDDLLDPKVWRAAMSAPGDAMVVMTGKKYWEITADESDTLAKTGAATARCFMLTDPKWLALSLFSFSILSIYGSRAMKEIMERKAAKTNTLPQKVNEPNA
jgi:hypothetical protein